VRAGANQNKNQQGFPGGNNQFKGGRGGLPF